MTLQGGASILDDVAAMGRADTEGMLGYLEGFADQVAGGWRIARELELPWETPRSVALLGMGGSAIGGDIVKAVWADRISAPVEVLRDYELPAWVGPDTLVIASSKSGDTEETLRQLESALQRRCPVICVSSGGALRRVAEAAKLPLVTFPAEGSPRASVGWSLGIVAGILERAGVLELEDAEVERAVDVRQGDGGALRTRRGHRRQPCQAAGLVAGRSLRRHQRLRLPGAGGPPLEDAAQREQQGRGGLRGAAGGDPQHGRWLRAARFAARSPGGGLLAQRARPSAQRAPGPAHGRRHGHRAGLAHLGGDVRRWAAGPCPQRHRHGRLRQRLHGVHVRGGPDPHRGHRPHQGAAQRWPIRLLPSRPSAPVASWRSR